jgi:DNA-binding protein HU-beta
MTKADLVENITKSTMVQKHDVQAVVDAVVSELAKSINRKENIYLRGFGTFKIVTRKAKPVRNIQKGESYITPAKDVVKFKACKKLEIK